MVHPLKHIVKLKLCCSYTLHYVELLSSSCGGEFELKYILPVSLNLKYVIFEGLFNQLLYTSTIVNIPVIVPWRVESWPRCINLYTVVDCVLYCCAPLFVFGIYTFRRSEKCLSVWVFCWVWNTSECDVWWYLQGICYHIADNVFLFALFYCFACWSGFPVRSWVTTNF